MGNLTLFSFASLAVLFIVYFFLITEKLNKVLVVALGANLLILLQIFKTSSATSQQGALEFVSRNLDVLGFVAGMMLLIGIIRQSGVFECIAIWLVKLVKGKPYPLLIIVGYLSLVMTIFLSNIPTILILTPILLILIKELKLPYMPYFFIMITMANIGGAVTPISDPTTYYQAKTVGLTFFEVLSNSGVIVGVLSIIVTAYCLLVFRKNLNDVEVRTEDIALFDPKAAIKDKKMLLVGVPVLVITILLMIAKEFITQKIGVTFDNATVVLSAAFLLIVIFNLEPQKVIVEYIDWEIIIFFTGLFIVVGSLEHTGIIMYLGNLIVEVTQGNNVALLFIITLGSCVLSMFIDNVPYNITMVGAIQAMNASGLHVYPLWWALNLGTSIGGAGSMIGAACNVIALNQAERDHFHTSFSRYIQYGFPLILLNGLMTFFLLWLKFYR